MDPSKIARGPGRPSKYRLKDGTIVPGVTTITGRFKESGALIHWAYTCGVEGIDYRRARDDAGDAGSLAHRMIESHIHGEPVDQPGDERIDPEALSRAKNAFANFVEWTEQTKVEIVATELPLVSEVHRFGGTLDAIGRINGELCLLDWKSSNGVYADYLAQVAAYVTLYEERYPDAMLNTMHLLRVDKEFAGFHHHRWARPVIEEAWKYFRLARELFDVDKRLKKAAA